MGNFRQVIQTKKEKAGGGRRRRIETLVAHIFFQKLLFFCSVLYSTVHGTVNAQSYKPN